MFRYDILERKLQAYFEPFRTTKPVVFRAWAKLFVTVDLLAKTDYGMYPSAEARADAWQEINIAFKGRGEAQTTGVVQDLYYAFGDKYETCLTAVEAIFKEAWAATPADYKPLFRASLQAEAFRKPGDEAAIALPVRGWRTASLLKSYAPQIAELDLDSIEWLVNNADDADLGAPEPEPEPVPNKNPHGFVLLTGGKA